MNKKIKIALFILLFISFLFRIVRIDYPKAFVFDEVYYAYTAQQYLKGAPGPWEWFSTPPTGHSYAWVNPPLPQEVITISMFIFGTQDSWTWRLPGVLVGVLAIFLVFEISKLLFKNDRTALISAFLFALDGLNFVQSRTAMLDIYLVAFILLSILFLLKKRLFLSAIFLGLAISSKWTGVYLLIPIILFLGFKEIKKIIYYIIIPPIIYLLVYTPFFLTGHNFSQFIDLIKQEFSYHTHLNATHTYASPWWSWPLNLYPVWYFVDYSKDKMANIFSGANPPIFWAGTVALVLSFVETIKKKSLALEFTIFGFLSFWLLWAASSRIMFLYYFAPAVPFMCMLLGYQLEKLSKKNPKLLIGILTLFFISFLIYYPFLTGIMLPKDWIKYFFLTNLSKNPFL